MTPPVRHVDIHAPQTAHARAIVLRRTPDGWTVYAAGTGGDARDARTKARVVAFFDAPPMTPQEIGALALHLWDRGYAVTMQCDDPSQGPNPHE